MYRLSPVIAGVYIDIWLLYIHTARIPKTYIQHLRVLATKNDFMHVQFAQKNRFGWPDAGQFAAMTMSLPINEHVLWMGFKTRGKPCVHAAHASRYYEMYSFYLLFMCTRCFNYMVTKRSNYPIAVYKV